MSDIVRKLEKHPGWGIVEAGLETVDTSTPTASIVVNGLSVSPKRRSNVRVPHRTVTPSAEGGLEIPLYLQYARLKENILGFLGGRSTPPDLDTEFEVPPILGNLLRSSITTLFASPWSVIDGVDRTGQYRTDLIIDGISRQEGEMIVTPRIIAHLSHPETLAQGDSGELITLQYSPITSVIYSKCVAYV